MRADCFTVVSKMILLIISKYLRTNYLPEYWLQYVVLKTIAWVKRFYMFIQDAHFFLIVPSHWAEIKDTLPTIIKFIIASNMLRKW